MLMHHRALAACGLLAATVLCAPTPASAVSFHTAKTLSQSGPGSQSAILTDPSAPVFCMLTTVLNSGNSSGEKMCALTNTVSGWMLSVSARNAGDFVQCSAWCWNQ